jgi:hypothetical protein
MIIRLILLTLLFCGSGLHAETFSHLDVKLLISVDWEGFSLEENNLRAFQQFRNDYPQVKIVHFLNAAYFTKAEANALQVAEKIRSVIRPGDELGLHLHAFESLLKAAGVSFRETETFWGYRQSVPLHGERGHDVPLSLFSVSELRRMIQISLQILNQNGFNKIQSFRAGGWIASPQVLEALALEGIRVDSSAVSPAIVGLVAQAHQPIFQINRQLWPDQTPMKHEPYVIQASAGAITEYPNNVGLADYISGEKAFSLLEKLVQANFSKQKQIHFHYGFHQETAAEFLPRVRRLLALMEQFTGIYRVSVTPVTLAELESKTYVYSVTKGQACSKVLAR